tara:strand:- start:592 stop:1155 length:564 start_codon:yes stop_codon:yes gene_type:complete
MNMKIKFFFFIIILISFINVHAKTDSLDAKFIPLKDFIILKFDIFIQKSINNLAPGGGITGISFQSINYDLEMDKKNNILISIDAVMNKKRYTKKKYYPKMRDCNQVRNKIFVNKYGYSPFRQNFNNLVNKDILTNKINDNVLNISTLNDDFKNKILDKTKIKINVLHPKAERNISCSGNLTDTELN